MKLVLASTSPRRKELLKEIISTYDIITTNFNEDILKQIQKDPKKLCEELSLGKAQEVFQKIYFKYLDYMTLVIISADTLISFQNEIIGKPHNEEDARQMLLKLQGKKNTIYTSTSIIIQKNDTIVTLNDLSQVDVYMKPMNSYEISQYIHSKEPLDKAGAYAIQGIGKKYIERYVGDFNCAVGLNTKFIKDQLNRYHILDNR